MKIAFVLVDYSLGRGGERATITIANALSRLFDVHLVSLYQSCNEPFFTVESAVSIHLIIPRNGTGFLARKRGELSGLRRHLASGNYSLVIGVAAYCSILLGMLRYFSNVPGKTAAWEHTNYGALPRGWKLLRSIFYRQLDGLVCLTPEDEIHYKKMLPRTQVIPNALSFTSAEKSPLTGKRILAAGAFEHEKGFDLLITAYSAISKQLPGWQLLLFGEGSLQPELEKLIARHHLEGSILLHPPVRSIREEMLKASLYVMSSRREGFGMVLIEAMECGLPCISFDCETGPRGIISHGRNGILVPPGNSDLLARAIVQLAGDPRQMKELAENGWRSVTRFSEKEITRQWVEFIHSLLSSPGRLPIIKT